MSPMHIGYPIRIVVDNVQSWPWISRDFVVDQNTSTRQVIDLANEAFGNPGYVIQHGQVLPYRHDNFIIAYSWQSPFRWLPGEVPVESGPVPSSPEQGAPDIGKVHLAAPAAGGTYRRKRSRSGVRKGRSQSGSKRKTRRSARRSKKK